MPRVFVILIINSATSKWQDFAFPMFKNKQISNMECKRQEMRRHMLKDLN